MIYIYALLDPRTSLVRYVGKSIHPKTRLAGHRADKSKTWRTNWLGELVGLGLQPELQILEELPDGANWQDREREWITKGRELGWPLTNCTLGGDGVSGLPEDTRQRMRLTWLGRKHRPESLLKISAASRARRHTKEWCAEMSVKMKGRKIAWADKVRNGVQKLSVEDIHQIRALLADGISQYVIADRYSVHQGTISNIKRGVSYGHYA